MMDCKLNIIGAGMAGLLAGCLLGKNTGKIFERQKQLPNNHRALLRFRSSVVGDRLGIPFRKVKVIKAVAGSVNPLADAVAYSLRTNGTATLRSLVSARGEVEERFIAPGDLIARMEERLAVPVTYGHDFNFKIGSEHPVISTMPMPLLMEKLGYNPQQGRSEKPIVQFKSIQGISITAELRDCDFCGTIYLPHFSTDNPASVNIYRASVTDNTLIIELAFPHAIDKSIRDYVDLLTASRQLKPLINDVTKHMGLHASMIEGSPVVSLQRYAKILPIDEAVRKRFILWASEHHNIYSFGRFATWRPGLLMDDLVQDLNVIQRLIAGESAYDWK